MPLDGLGVSDLVDLEVGFIHDCFELFVTVVFDFFFFTDVVSVRIDVGVCAWVVGTLTRFERAGLNVHRLVVVFASEGYPLVSV